ncbi:HAD family hydrolase [Zhouia sp. PK063]|uniref:HAD family hydrolase n=1 Tax=Zhouia sp. PK063 TaxID=3373602 RepID=UPI0037A04247
MIIPENLANVKLVVSDMDGTLLNDKGQVSDQFFNIFHRLKQHNILFAAASGRQYYSIVEKLAAIKDEIVVIAENGGITKKAAIELGSILLDHQTANDLILLLRNIKNVEVVLCGKKQAYIESNNQEFIDFFNEYYFKYQKVDDLTTIKDDDFFKIAVYHNQSSEDFIYPHFKHLEDQLQVKISGDYWLDLSHIDSHKGNALKALQERLNITPEETMVFGDFNNDLEMLALAKFSFAMQNAHPNVKKIANYNTKSNNENGVEFMLEALLKAKATATRQKQ